MNSIFRGKWSMSPFVGMAFLLLVAPLLASCAPDATAAIISPNSGQVEAKATALAADPRNMVTPVAAPVIPLVSELSAEEIAAGLPEEVAAALASADAAAGESLSLANGCTACHGLDADVVQAGPTWNNLGNRSVVRAIELGQEGPAAYLYESISDPNAYIVDGFQPNVMLQTFAEQLNPDEFATIIAYILSQQDGPAE